MFVVITRLRFSWQSEITWNSSCALSMSSGTYPKFIQDDEVVFRDIPHACLQCMLAVGPAQRHRELGGRVEANRLAGLEDAVHGLEVVHEDQAEGAWAIA